MPKSYDSLWGKLDYHSVPVEDKERAMTIILTPIKVSRNGALQGSFGNWDDVDKEVRYHLEYKGTLDFTPVNGLTANNAIELGRKAINIFRDSGRYVQVQLNADSLGDVESLAEATRVLSEILESKCRIAA